MYVGVCRCITCEIFKLWITLKCNSNIYMAKDWYIYKNIYIYIFL